jgi:hypothetical protein
MHRRPCLFTLVSIAGTLIAPPASGESIRKKRGDDIRTPDALLSDVDEQISDSILL